MREGEIFAHGMKGIAGRQRADVPPVRAKKEFGAGFVPFSPGFVGMVAVDYPQDEPFLHAHAFERFPVVAVGIG